ncbi:MAG TPA: hypothetical protein VGQ34_11210, partial [Sphingomicrobium sp.]|nr:hypothetical protein [Sphingomicrobium sp.]
GYRQSNFDPNAAWGESGPPLRPYNWVQWTGVGFIVFGGLFFAAYVLGRIGIIPKWIDDGIPFVAFMPLGAALMNSRRQPQPADAKTLKRRRILLIAVALGALVLGAAIAILIDTQGA